MFRILLCVCLLLIPCMMVGAEPGNVAAVAAAKTVDVDNTNFLKVFNRAIDEARKEGTITWVQAFRLKVAARNPERVAQIKQGVAEAAQDEGKVVNAVDAMAPTFDWTTLLAFLKEILPIILMILQMFS